MHNTIGDVAQTNISRETDYLHEFVQYPIQKFLKLCHFPTLRSYKTVLKKKACRAFVQRWNNVETDYKLIVLFYCFTKCSQLQNN